MQDVDLLTFDIAEHDNDDDNDDEEADFGAGNNKKSVASDASQVPGSWKWGDNNNNNKARNRADLPSVSASASATASATRKGAAARQSAASAASSNGIEPETTKKKGKKAGNGPQQRSAWGKRATVEEVPDAEGDDLMSAGSQGESLPYNSRSILEPLGAEEEEEDQPRILEPKPSKPRTMYENIFQYGEAGAAGAGAAVADDLRDELGDWSEERLASALARMSQESSEMGRRVNGLGPTGPPNNAGINGGASAATSVSMSKLGAEQPMTVPKKVRWQSQQGFNPAATQPSALQTFAANKMASRSYDDEAFSSPTATIPAFHFGSYERQQTNGGWPSVNNNHQYGNHFAAAAPDVESEDDELARTARSLFDNLHFAPQRNKPGFAAA